MKIKGAISINRSSNNVVRITFDDVDARVTFAVAEMSVADFGMAITGLSYVDAEIETRGLDRIGTSYEHKEVVVPCEWSPKDKAALLAPFEVDGWVGRKSDLGNGHRRTTDNTGYLVTFTRNVKKEK